MNELPQIMRRCEITSNPCGSDTWEVHTPCKCATCQSFLMDRLHELWTENERLRCSEETDVKAFWYEREKREAAEAKLHAVGDLPKHDVIWDQFGHYYVVMSSGVRTGKVVFVDDLAAALQEQDDE